MRREAMSKDEAFKVGCCGGRAAADLELGRIERVQHRGFAVAQMATIHDCCGRRRRGRGGGTVWELAIELGRCAASGEQSAGVICDCHLLYLRLRARSILPLLSVTEQGRSRCVEGEER